MSAPPTELSLTAAKAKFFEVTAEKRRLHLEHKKLMRAHIDECITANLDEAIYVVPTALSGAFATYDVNEMALWLIKQCRAGGFEVNLLTSTPPTIRVWGWYDDNWLDLNKPPSNAAASVRPVVVVKPTSSKPQPRFQPTTKQRPTAITSEQASVMAQTGALSQKLRASLARSQRKGY